MRLEAGPGAWSVATLRLKPGAESWVRGETKVEARARARLRVGSGAKLRLKPGAEGWARGETKVEARGEAEGWVNG